jgi:hypothetical protein
MELTSLVATLNTAVQALRTELVSAQLAADSSGLTTVMGAGCKAAGIVELAELQGMIRADPRLTAAMQGLDAAKFPSLRASVRALMTQYATRVAESGYRAQFMEWQTRIEMPVVGMISAAVQNIESILRGLEDLRVKATRLQTMSINSGPSAELVKEYTDNLEFVCRTAHKLAMYDSKISKYSKDIDELMFNGRGNEAKAVQDQRQSMVSERKYVEHGLISHFEAGTTHARGDIKLTLKDLKIPEAIEKGKGVELIQSLKSFFKNRAPQYYAVMSDVIRIMAESKIGKFFKPATAKNGYGDVKIEIREAYSLQARELYDELCLKVPKAIMNNIRVSFKYGVEELQACCEVGDGPMAIFCLLALYRPAGLAYRDSLRTKLEEGSHLFKGGTNPAAKIKELRSIILEATDLNVRVAWRTTGKGIVTVMSERGNNFAQVLSKYNMPGGIMDPEDCIIELNRMFTDIEETIVQLEDSGIDIKRVMAIKVMAVDVGAKVGKPGTNLAICWYGNDCTRTDCTFTHSASTGKGGAKDSKPKGKGNSSNKQDGGKTKGKGKGKGKGKETTCQAKSCKAPSRGWPLCNTCRREGLEKGSMRLKDGTDLPVLPAAKKTEGTTEARLAILEKQITANSANAKGEEEQSDGEDLELFTGNNAPRSAQILAAQKLLANEASKRKRANSANVFDRLGKNDPYYPNKVHRTKFSTEAELESEFNDY